MSEAVTPSIRSSLGSAVKDALTSISDDQLAGVPKAELGRTCAALTTDALVKLLKRYRAEHRRFLEAFADFDGALAKLPVEDRVKRPGLELAASFNQAWASQDARRRLACGGSGIQAGGALSGRCHALAVELESRFASGAAKRPAEQQTALDAAVKADLERTEADLKVEQLRKKYNRAGGLARPAIEPEILAAVAASEAASRRCAAALAVAREWSAIP